MPRVTTLRLQEYILDERRVAIILLVPDSRTSRVLTQEVLAYPTADFTNEFW